MMVAARGKSVVVQIMESALRTPNADQVEGVVAEIIT